MAKSIGLTNHEYEILQQAKKAFENLTGVKVSWGAYLVALAAGALASYTIAGFNLKCSECGGEMQMRLVMPKLVFEKAEDEEGN